MSQTIAEALKRASEELRAAGVPNDVLDAQTLLGHALGRDRTYLIVNFHQELPGAAREQYAALLGRRAAGEPLQYITGRQEFFGLEFEVTPDVLIPRPETELIVEETLRLARGVGRPPLVIDVGTGSGCIAIAIARELPGARVIATDVSPAALRVARRNAARHSLTGRVSFVAADLLGALRPEPIADFIVSNPPYVAGRELPALQREVRDWEPEVALTDRGDGLTFYRRLLAAAPGCLRPGGFLLCEMGYTQSDPIAALVDGRDWAARHVLADLQGIPRTMVLERHGGRRPDDLKE